MKRKYLSILLAAMTLAASVNVYAAPSIGQIIPEAPKVIEGNLSGNQELIVKDVDTGAYKDKTVAEVVTKVNDDTTKTTMNEVLKDLNVDTTEPVKTENTNKVVNPSLYEPITPFVDLVIKEDDKITYETTGEIKATITIEAAKDVKKKDVLLMQIDPTTGKVSFIAVEKLDKKTGEVTATFDTLGPVALVEKVPIVTKNISPEKYPDKKVAEVAKKLKDEKSGFKLEDFVADLTDTEGKEIKLEDGKTIKLDDYVSKSSLVDMAIKMSDDYSYDMSGSLLAEVNCDIDKIDWQSLVTANDEDFDVKAAEENMDLLTEIEPFVIEDSIVVQADATTGELNYLVEPELSFEYPETEEEEADAEDKEETADTENTETETADADTEETTADSDEDTEETETTDDENELMNWVVEDEDKENAEQPNLVIKGEFKGMGPLAIFMKEAE